MKRMYVVAGWAILFAEILGVAPQKFSFNRSLRSSSTMNSFNNPTFISTATVLSNPGTYIVIRDIVFTPTSDNQSCIELAASNITLDLNGKTISQNDASLTFTGIIGIEVDSNTKNHVIRNGAISSMTEAAIYINDGVEIADIFDLTILRVGEYGVKVDGSDLDGVESLNFTNIDIEDTGRESIDAYGFYFKGVSTANMENCVSGETFSFLGEAYGIKIENCDSIRAKSCVFNNNASGGNKATGVSIVNSNNILFIDTLSANNTCTLIDPTTRTCGFEIENSSAIFLHDCTASSNYGYGAVYGFYIDGSSYCRIDDTESLANLSTGSSCAGFYSNNGTNNLIKLCDAMSNNGALNGYGVLLTGTERGSGVGECAVEADIGLTGTAFGIFMGPATTVSGVMGCKVLGHQGGSAGFGIYDAAGESSTNSFFANVAIKNSTNYSLASSAMAQLFSGPLSAVPGTFQNVSL